MSSKGFEYGSTIYLDLFEALKLAAILTIVSNGYFKVVYANYSNNLNSSVH